MGTHISKLNPAGSSTVHPDGTLEIRTDKGTEDFETALDFWFPSPNKPKIVILAIHEADPKSVEILKKLNGGLHVMFGKVWEIELTVDGEKVSRFLTGEKEPEASEAMRYLTRDYARKLNS